ncbi:MAG: dockerin type I domain-containing protein [Pirellulaceae bacterium]
MHIIDNSAMRRTRARARERVRLTERTGRAIGRRRLSVEPLERRDLLSGVTLITHGFDSNADGWVTAMAQAIAARPDLSIDQTVYRVEVTDPGHDKGPLSVTGNWLSGPLPTDSETSDPEIALVVDWSDMAGELVWGGGYTRSTADVAVAVAEKLLDADFLAGWTQPLASLPLHLIGHSRGGSLVGALAHQLGLRGIWVDQVTTLDPHPVDGINDPLNYDFGDAPMVAWDNVVYWDNYWRANSDLFDLSGEAVENVHDVHLNDAVLGSGGYTYEHSDVHLWYHGTIDTSENPPANNWDEDVPNDWYGGANPERLVSGYAYSRLARGEREPAGLSAAVAGGLAVREHVTPTFAAWPNVLGVTVTSASATFIDGAPIPVDYLWQDADSSSTITFALDIDNNPFNANQQHLLDVDASAAATLQSDSIQLSTGNTISGMYYVLATIEDGTGQIRYAYAPTVVTVENPAANLPPTDIVLDAAAALENVSGYRIGHVTVVDPNPLDSHTFVLSDTRFEVVAGTLKLRNDQSLSMESENSVVVDVTAIDAGQLALVSPKRFVLTVTANPFAWHNSLLALDVSGNGQISSLDALRVINELNDPKVISSTGSLPRVRPADVVNYLDVNGNGSVSPLDALLVINYLNQEGEGESGAEWASESPSLPASESVELMGMPGGRQTITLRQTSNLEADELVVRQAENKAWCDHDVRTVPALRGGASRAVADDIFELVGSGGLALDWENGPLFDG